MVPNIYLISSGPGTFCTHGTLLYHRLGFLYFRRTVTFRYREAWSNSTAGKGEVDTSFKRLWKHSGGGSGALNNTVPYLKLWFGLWSPQISVLYTNFTNHILTAKHISWYHNREENWSVQSDMVFLYFLLSKWKSKDSLLSQTTGRRLERSILWHESHSPSKWSFWFYLMVGWSERM